MKIALIGYGKMGHMIEGIALGRGHEIVCIVDPFYNANENVNVNHAQRANDNHNRINNMEALKTADVAIEFTTPATAEANVRMCWEAGLPVVCGSTGWDAAALLREAEETGHQLIWKSNFSIGVNVMFEISKQLADVLRPYGYEISMQEIHHIHKLDKPSGTAKTLAECVGYTGEIESIREGEVPGTHSITWTSEVDKITLTHEAFGRQGFALGAVIAAESLYTPKII